MKRLYFAVLLMGMVQGSFGGERSVEKWRG